MAEPIKHAVGLVDERTPLEQLRDRAATLHAQLRAPHADPAAVLASTLELLHDKLAELALCGRLKGMA